MLTWAFSVCRTRRGAGHFQVSETLPIFIWKLRRAVWLSTSVKGAMNGSVETRERSAFTS